MNEPKQILFHSRFHDDDDDIERPVFAPGETSPNPTTVPVLLMIGRDFVRQAN